MSREKKTILPLQWMQWSLLLIVLLLFMAACGGGGGGGGGGTRPSCNSGYCIINDSAYNYPCCPVSTPNYCAGTNLCYTSTININPVAFPCFGPSACF